MYIRIRTFIVYLQCVEIVIKTNRNKTISHPEPVDVTESREEYRYRPEKNVIRMKQRFTSH